MEIVDRIKDLPWHESRRWSKRALSRINKIIVHQELANGDIDSVNRYHITPSPQNHLSPKGAPHFAYHYGIEKDGTIIQANNLSDITWHCKMQNSVSVGIMVAGDFTGPGHSAGEPEEAQLESIEKLVDYIIDLLPQLDKYHLYGHCDFGKQACPGNTLMAFIEDYKT